MNLVLTDRILPIKGKVTLWRKGSVSAIAQPKQEEVKFCLVAIPR